MIVEFAVRAGQGEPSGFDRGDMVWSGGRGEASSVGHVPDQGMMIYLAVPELLDSLSGLVARRSRNASFTAVDSSFGLDFRVTKAGVGITSRSGSGPGLVARVSRIELGDAVLAAAEELERRSLAGVGSGDGVVSAYRAALDRFRLIVWADRLGLDQLGGVRGGMPR
ncbi:hypothetical protein ACFTWH_01480 [Streptomyces sp. NPDC057011]|uniref:hypothetical protein n=1 Tax=unclassified Streptomyces TaxID=2593676 RepID=UPI0036349201